MSTFSGSKITQQMYTRERRGVYRSTEGFDTVAKSDSLDNNFVKKTLHPFCLYDAPAELTVRGEKQEALYPAALHLFHTESGETVIGNSQYQATDFTGQRSAFFAHNYVVPASRAEEIVLSYADWLQADFAGSYEGELGGTLPELTSIPVLRKVRRSDPLAVLRSLGFGEELFKALLQAVMTSVAGKKKIYVALDVPISELSARAAELTEHIFAALPYEFRRRLGVITYANEPKSRKYIHLTFVEKGSLRPGDRSVEKDFTFDLVSGRIGNADFGESRQPYADLVWKMLGRKAGGLDDFARFADSMLAGESGERKLSPALYNELAVFYEIEQGDEALYTENKSAVLGGLLSYLQADGAIDTRVRLNDMFLERFDREYDLIRQKGILVPAVMEIFKEYFTLKGHTYKVKVVDYFINGMLNSQSAGREDVLGVAYGVIESNDELSEAFFKRVLAQPVFRKQLLEPYIEARLATAVKSADIMAFVVHWGRFLPEALQQPFVRDAVRDYLMEKLQRETDPVAAVAAIHETVDKVEKERRKGAGLTAEVLSLLQELTAVADRFLLNRLSLSEMSQEQLLEIAFLRDPREGVVWQPPLDLITKQKANALRAAYRWFGEEKPNEAIFNKLSPKELDDVQLLGRRWLQEARTLEPFDRLPLAFYHSSDREGGPLDYDELLKLVNRKAGVDKEEVYRFLAWSQGNPLFAISNKKLHPGYRRAILKYFQKHDREAFKSRDFRKSYVSAAGPALQNVYNEARSQLASPLARWISRSRFQLLISGSLLGVVVIIAIIIISMLRPEGTGIALPETSPSPTPAQTDVSQLPPASVYLKSNSDVEAGSVLVFTFAKADECLQFKPTEIGLVDSAGKITDTYKVVSTNSTCPVPASGTPGSADQDNAATGGTATDGDFVGTTVTNGGNTADTVSKDKAAATSANTAGSNSSASATAAGSSEQPTAPDTGQAVSLQVDVTLEPGVVLVEGSVLKAGNYSLTLQPDPGSASTPDSSEPSNGSSADPSAVPSATASPEVTAE